MTRVIKGIAASEGYAFAKAYRLIHPNLTVIERSIEQEELEIERFHTSLNKVRLDLEKIKKKVVEQQGSENAGIFDAHLMILKDPELVSETEKEVKEKKVNVEVALKSVTDRFIALFEQMDNEYMRERATDIKDVRKRILAYLLDVSLPNPGLINEEVIIVTDDLTPSDTAQINKKFVRAFITNIGGPTSHSAIMARSLGIPAVVGTKKASEIINNGDYLIVDGLEGNIQINPTSDIVEKYKSLSSKFKKEKLELEIFKYKPTLTRDHVKVELGANIGSLQEIDNVINSGAEAIGLYRTEFLYMEKSKLPTEDEQFQAYKTVLEKMNGKPVVVRTLDIGGDKHLPYWDLQGEMNPFLGLRAIRLTLKERDIFRTQLRALLRASNYGKLKIMFPMVATIEEFREAKMLLKEEEHNLIEEGHTVKNDLEVGIMVEIPSTVILADHFAKEVDFFSIGTNDLIQYTFAADRMNESVSSLYQPYSPAILRLIKMVIDAAHKQGKKVGMCGEMAGDSIAIPLLIGLGLDEFSMSSSSILRARSQINKLSKADMKILVEKALTLQSYDEVQELVESEINRIFVV